MRLLFRKFFNKETNSYDYKFIGPYDGEDINGLPSGRYVSFKTDTTIIVQSANSETTVETKTISNLLKNKTETPDDGLTDEQRAEIAPFMNGLENHRKFVSQVAQQEAEKAIANRPSIKETTAEYLENRWKPPENEENRNEPSVTPLNMGPNGNKSDGRVYYKEGLRYMRADDGVLERFAAANEPLKVDDRLFTGYSAAGEFEWDTAANTVLNVVSEKSTETNKVSTISTIKTTQSSQTITLEKGTSVAEKTTKTPKEIVSDTKAAAAKITGKKPEIKTIATTEISATEASELEALAAELLNENSSDSSDLDELEATPSAAFDDSAFLDDLSDVSVKTDPSGMKELKITSKNETTAEYTDKIETKVTASKNSCRLKDDKVTLIITFKGDRFKKTFKSDVIAARQLSIISAYIENNDKSLEDLLMSEPPTYKKIAPAAS